MDEKFLYQLIISQLNHDGYHHVAGVLKDLAGISPDVLPSSHLRKIVKICVKWGKECVDLPLLNTPDKHAESVPQTKQESNCDNCCSRMIGQVFVSQDATHQQNRGKSIENQSQVSQRQQDTILQRNTTEATPSTLHSNVPMSTHSLYREAPTISTAQFTSRPYHSVSSEQPNVYSASSDNQSLKQAQQPSSHTVHHSPVFLYSNISSSSSAPVVSNPPVSPYPNTRQTTAQQMQPCSNLLSASQQPTALYALSTWNSQTLPNTSVEDVLGSLEQPGNTASYSGTFHRENPSTPSSSMCDLQSLQAVPQNISVNLRSAKRSTELNSENTPVQASCSKEQRLSSNSTPSGQIRIKEEVRSPEYMAENTLTPLKEEKKEKKLNWDKLGREGYKCVDCDKVFQELCYLKTHFTKIHRSDALHKCPHCKKGFVERRFLQQHIKYHSEERPYNCTLCNKGFLKPSDLKRHLMIHTGERPYVCDICSKGFIQFTTMSDHRRKHRNVDDSTQLSELKHLRIYRKSGASESRICSTPIADSLLTAAMDLHEQACKQLAGESAKAKTEEMAESSVASLPDVALSPVNVTDIVTQSSPSKEDKTSASTRSLELTEPSYFTTTKRRITEPSLENLTETLQSNQTLHSMDYSYHDLPDLVPIMSQTGDHVIQKADTLTELVPMPSSGQNLGGFSEEVLVISDENDDVDESVDISTGSIEIYRQQ